MIWSAEAKSPDGKYVASARAFANSGFGTNGIPTTFVYLSWGNGAAKPLEVMAFADASDTTSDDRVELRWVSSKELEIGYTKTSQEIDFQAIRFGDVSITLRAID